MLKAQERAGVSSSSAQTEQNSIQNNDALTERTRKRKRIKMIILIWKVQKILSTDLLTGAPSLGTIGVTSAHHDFLTCRLVVKRLAAVLLSLSLFAVGVVCRMYVHVDPRWTELCRGIPHNDTSAINMQCRDSFEDLDIAILIFT